MPVLDAQKLIDNRVSAIREFHQIAGTNRAELDLSGGVDSAVLCGLLTKSLGPSNVTCVYTCINSSVASLSRAKKVAETFGVGLIEMDLSDWYDDLIDRMVEAYIEGRSPNPPGGPRGSTARGVRGLHDAAVSKARHELEVRFRDPTVLGSIRSCIRAPIGRGFNRFAGGGLRHGTGNECEDRWLRFFQKGGDGEVDCNAIVMLSKGEVYQLAIALGVPRCVVQAVPSPDLWSQGDSHNDEDELLSLAGVPFTYSRVDPDTGEYSTVGTIERVSRYADDWPALFEQDLSSFGALLSGSSLLHPALGRLERTLVEGLLKAARRIERTTRHKWNPNCPSLGTRHVLVEAGLLTNALPDMESERANFADGRAQ